MMMRFTKLCSYCEHKFVGAKGVPCPECGTEMTILIGEVERWADTTDAPVCPPPEALEEQTRRDHYCEYHQTILITDSMGRHVCVACVVEEAL